MFKKTYIFQSQEVTVYKLKDDIEDAKDRLMFLLDYAIYPSKLTKSYRYHLRKLKVVSKITDF